MAKAPANMAKSVKDLRVGEANAVIAAAAPGAFEAQHLHSAKTG